jgi:hypothetical protein
MIKYSRLLLGLLALFVLAACSTSSLGKPAQQLLNKIDASLLWEKSRSANLSLTAEGIVPLRHNLVEDDAPAFGYAASGGGNEELLSGKTVLKKHLFLEKVPTDTAFIVAMFYPKIPAEANNGRHLRFNVNGQNIDYVLEHFWTRVPVPPSWLIAGENIITVQTLEEDAAFSTFLAIDELYAIGGAERLSHPNRSAKSVDDGLTWEYDNLGSRNDLDGEYPIRLLLKESPGVGTLQSQVFDLAPEAQNYGLRLDAKILNATIILNGSSTVWVGGREYRQGNSPFPDASWTDWTPLPKDGDLSVPARYVEIRLTFGLNSNALTGLSIHSSFRIGHDEGWQVTSIENHPRLMSSFDYPMEDSNNPILKQLREKYQLDAVVAEAKTELDTLKLLSSWVAGQWDWYLLPPDRDFNSWNALEIMDTGPDGEQRGGYCLQYAITYMQALQSFGIPARIVNCNYTVWSGHEMTEVWSRSLGKWILMDANFDIHFVDRRNGEIMNALESHKVFLQHYYPGESIDRDDWSRQSFIDRISRSGKPDDVLGVVGGGARSGTLTDYEWWNPPLTLSPYCGGFGFLNTGYFRILPRSNFLSQPAPLPVNHGRIHWGWDGYLCWTDPQTPRSQEHKIFTSREADLYWNLDEIDFIAKQTGKNKLRLFYQTNPLPGSEIHVIHNGQSLAHTGKQIDIQLSSGNHHIEMLVKDAIGRPGKSSHLNLKILE